MSESEPLPHHLAQSEQLEQPDIVASFVASLEGKSKQEIDQAAEDVLKEGLRNLFSLQTLIDPAGSLLRFSDRIDMVRGAGDYLKNKQWDNVIEYYHGEEATKPGYFQERWGKAIEKLREQVGGEEKLQG